MFLKILHTISYTGFLHNRSVARHVCTAYVRRGRHLDRVTGAAWSVTKHVFCGSLYCTNSRVFFRFVLVLYDCFQNCQKTTMTEALKPHVMSFSRSTRHCGPEMLCCRMAASHLVESLNRVRKRRGAFTDRIDTARVSNFLNSYFHFNFYHFYDAELQ